LELEFILRVDHLEDSLSIDALGKSRDGDSEVGLHCSEELSETLSKDDQELYLLVGRKFDSETTFELSIVVLTFLKVKDLLNLNGVE
jgi:hypothetical protein